MTPEEIVLTDCLSAEDYYRTDPHWRQERLFPVAERIAEALGVQIDGAEAYSEWSFGTFYGAYYGQSALPVAPDELLYLVSTVTDVCTVTSVEHDGTTHVYTPEEYDGMDAYDIISLRCGGAADRGKTRWHRRIASWSFSGIPLAAAWRRCSCPAIAR